MFPIDMVKTRLQASKEGVYKSPIDCFLKIIRNEGGVRALYRGLFPNLIGVTPEKSMKLVRRFTILSFFKYFYIFSKFYLTYLRPQMNLFESI